MLIDKVYIVIVPIMCNVCSALELNEVNYNLLYVEVSNLKYFPSYVHRKVQLL